MEDNGLIPPFVWLRGRPYLVTNWEPDDMSDCWLVLRPLDEAEIGALMTAEEVQDIELFYGLMGQTTAQKRLDSFEGSEPLPRS